MTQGPAASGTYLIVSPVKDEERHVERTLQSVTRQTVLPAKWIIVDDGSTDATPQILQRYAQAFPWIQVVTRVKTGPRQPGSAVMHAFYHGLARADGLQYDHLVKLDCDLDLPPHYFESLLRRFDEDPRLGIASGVYKEQTAESWSVIDMPPYHAAGASKFMRRRCWEDIGGFVRERGWDTVDELRAQVRGWSTCHFADLDFLHLKPEGSGIGNVRTNVMHGDVYYLTGGGALFLTAKALHRMVRGSPPLVGGLALLYGYLRSRFSGRERLVDEREAAHYRRLLNGRLLRRSAPRPAGGQSASTEQS